MKIKALFTVIIVFCLTGCSTLGGNKISNETLYGAIVKQGEKQNETLGEIVKLLSAKNSSENKKEETPRINERKITIGTTVSDEEILGANVSSKKSKTITTNDEYKNTDQRLARLEKRVYATERIVSNHNKRLGALENARRKLSWEISQVGIDSFPGIVIGKFAKNSAKITSDIESQIKAVAEKYNAAAKNSGAGKLEVVVTGYNDKGGISEKRGTAVLRILEKYLSDKFDVKYTGEDDTAEQSLPGKVFISNPFIQTAS